MLEVEYNLKSASCLKDSIEYNSIITIWECLFIFLMMNCSKFIELHAVTKVDAMKLGAVTRINNAM